jgi:hypothetical protein
MHAVQLLAVFLCSLNKGVDQLVHAPEPIAPKAQSNLIGAASCLGRSPQSGPGDCGGWALRQRVDGADEAVASEALAMARLSRKEEPKQGKIF